jgi:hypothetical protein
LQLLDPGRPAAANQIRKEGMNECKDFIGFG